MNGAQRGSGVPGRGKQRVPGAQETCRGLGSGI